MFPDVRMPLPLNHLFLSRRNDDFTIFTRWSFIASECAESVYRKSVEINENANNGAEKQKPIFIRIKFLFLLQKSNKFHGSFFGIFDSFICEESPFRTTEVNEDHPNETQIGRVE